MAITEDLYHPVDELDEDAVGELREYAHWRAADEDEPISEDELVRVRGGKAAIAARGCVTVEELDGASRS
jgi:hypothetical protein